MGDSRRHVLTHIQVGASDGNKAGQVFCHVTIITAAGPSYINVL